MSKHTFGQWIFALRPWSIPASAMPIIVTLAYLYFKGSEINWLIGGWTLIGMVLFHLAGNVWSDYFDYKKKVDAEDTFGAKTLTTGMFQPNEILRLAIVLLCLAVVSGLGLLAYTYFAGFGLDLLWIGLGGVVLTMAYPLLKYNALGDVDIILTFAVLPTLGTSLTTTGAIDCSVLLIALPVGLITDGILHSNNTRDTESDSRAEIKTMAMSLGAKVSAWLYAVEVIFPIIWIIALSIIGLLPYTAMLVALTLPIAIGCAKTMMSSVTKGSEAIADIDVKTAQLQLLFSLVLTAGLIAGKFIFA